MITRIQKWGNSLALRIPKPMAVELKLDQDSKIEIRQEKGYLVLIPIRKHRFTLEELMDKVNDDNLHGEVDTGKPVGNEVW